MSVIAVFIIIGVALLIVMFASIFLLRLSQQEKPIRPENRADKNNLQGSSEDRNNLDQN